MLVWPAQEDENAVLQRKHLSTLVAAEQILRQRARDAHKAQQLIMEAYHQVSPNVFIQATGHEC